MSKIISKFVRRLEKIGIQVDLEMNYPWVYLRRVNGKPVSESFRAEHGFTAFFMPVRTTDVERFSDRRQVFNKIREINE